VSALTSRTKRTKRLLCVLIIATAVAMAVVTAASAEWHKYCTNGCSGPNEIVNKSFSRNETGTGLVDRLWKYNGGSNYNEVNKAYSSGAKEYNIASPGFEHIDGHGQVERWYKEFSYTMLEVQYIE
jgi:hypothetical protein